MAPRGIRVSHNGRCTQVLLVHGSALTLLAEVEAEDVEAVLEQIRADFPSLPIDVRPGAVRKIL